MRSADRSNFLGRCVWSVVMGPVFGFAAYWFARGAGATRAHAPRDCRLPLWCAVVFPVIGLLATPFLQLLGNGKSVAQEVFGSNIGLTLAVVLLLLRVLVTLGALRAGAEGGLLTPGLSIGALLGIILGGLWNYAPPGVPLAAFAIIGGAAFLASSMKMPLTAVVLIMEFTRAGHDFLIPMLFGVIGSLSVFYLCTQHGLNPHGERTMTISLLTHPFSPPPSSFNRRLMARCRQCVTLIWL